MGNGDDVMVWRSETVSCLIAVAGSMMILAAVTDIGGSHQVLPRAFFGIFGAVALIGSVATFIYSACTRRPLF